MNKSQKVLYIWYDCICKTFKNGPINLQAGNQKWFPVGGEDELGGGIRNFLGDRIVVYLSEWWLYEYLHIYPNSPNCIYNIKFIVCKF